MVAERIDPQLIDYAREIKCALMRAVAEPNARREI